MFASPGLAREVVVARVTALVSVSAGAVFALAAAGVAREGARAFAGDAPERRGREEALVLATLLSQGAVLVFLGYVELYAWPAALAVAFAWAGLRVARGASPLALALGVLALAVAFHFSNLVLAPAALVLAAARLRRAEQRRGALRDLALTVALAAAAVASARANGHDVMADVRALVASNSAAASYLFSRAHVRDFFNEHARLGPLGLPLVLALALPVLRERRPGGAARAFAAVLAASIVAATWRTPDMPLGYARDWDVFAAAGLVLAAAALLALLDVVRGAGARRGLLAVALALSLSASLPWFALNHAESASLARFATLPLGLGRTESTLAWWWMQRGDHARAREWIERSLRANPDNVRAVDLHGRIALLEGRPEDAVADYRTAVLMRPERAEYRLQLAFALHGARRYGEALATLDTLERMQPDEPTMWLQRAIVLAALGRDEEARAALERALALHPALEGTARRLLPALREAR